MARRGAAADPHGGECLEPNSRGPFGRLRALPIERVKIDQSFVRDMAGDGAAICEAVLAMARSLDLDVIAEGVETADQLEFLSAKGCRQIQGYLVSPPVDAATFATLTGLPGQRTAAEAAEPLRR